MNPDLTLAFLTSLGWLILSSATQASYRLKRSQMVKKALVWVVRFGGLFLIVEWFMVIRGTTSAVL